MRLYKVIGMASNKQGIVDVNSIARLRLNTVSAGVCIYTSEARAGYSMYECAVELIDPESLTPVVYECVGNRPDFVRGRLGVRSSKAH
jgi:hypothetical protein